MSPAATTPSRIGLLLLFAFVISQAARDVYLGQLFGELTLFETAALAFGTATAVFGFWALLFARPQLALLKQHWRTVVALNATTALAWLSYFGAIKLANPAAANLAFAGVAPIGVHLLVSAGFARQDDGRSGRRERLWHWGLLGTVALLAAAASGDMIGGTSALAGVGLASLSGMVITVESVLAKRMSEAGVSAPVIVAARFMLVAIISAAMTARLPAPFSGMHAMEIIRQCAILLIILVGPISLAQAGLARTSPLVSGAVLALGPVVTLALLALTSAVQIDPAMFVITLLYTVFASGGAWATARHSGKAMVAA